MQSIDIGFQRLDLALRELRASSASQQVSQIITWLENHYRALVERSLMHDLGDGSNNPQLMFPKKSEIFIPQAFKYLVYSGNEHLEREETWVELQIEQNLNTFLLEYLRSPESVLTPLVILGMPGSGKSLLSSMIAARLCIAEYRPVLVSLRDTDAELPLHQQIIQKVKHITGSSIDWATFAANIDRSLLLILDGYDELLQVHDKTFGNYLNIVSQFQEDELDMGRAAVRTIVTSRITLIDKTRIPRGAMIVRLQPFDDVRQQQWINIWNKVNQEYFEQSPVQPFALTNDPSVRELAEQPLLRRFTLVTQISLLPLYLKIRFNQMSNIIINLTLIFPDCLSNLSD